jgi:hypothetical protein
MIAKELASGIRDALEKQGIDGNVECCVFNVEDENRYAIKSVVVGGGFISFTYEEEFRESRMNADDVLRELDLHPDVKVAFVNKMDGRIDTLEIDVDDCLGTAIDINVGVYDDA